MNALVAALLLAQADALVPSATVTHEPLSEISGIVKSRTYDGVFWVHNDSGDSARIFAIQADGTVVLPGWLAEDYAANGNNTDKPVWPGIQISLAHNSDWEDIALDDGTLYIADMGNNGNARRDLGVYAVPEPNPLERGETRTLAWYPIAYPDQEGFPPMARHFDCEAIFASGGKLFFITKHRDPFGQQPETGANLYRLDTRNTDRVNVLRRVDGAEDLGGWVTAADLSPDGRTLAVLCQAPVASVWLFDRPAASDRYFQGNARRLFIPGTKQAEAVAWDGRDHVLVVNEQREIFRVAVNDFVRAER